MGRFLSLCGVALGLIMSVAGMASADTSRLPPGDPCGAGPGRAMGNPCGGNAGNPGAMGGVRRNMNPPAPSIEMPAVRGREAFVEQIGNGNVAQVKQSAANAHARVRQSGDRNDSMVVQKGAATSYFEGVQTGSANISQVLQEGTGSNVVRASQTGDDNWMSVRQTAGSSADGMHNGAVLAQNGSRNDMDLLQDGSGNKARLTQEGNDNQMSLVQTGNNNSLTWTQQGNGLSNLFITQDGHGGQTNMTITQTRQ